MKKPLDNQFFIDRTFRKWFRNSLLIILTFILSGILLYLGALYVTKRVIIMAQEQSTEQTKDLIDIKLLNFKKDISVLALNDRIVSASYIKRPFTGNDYYNYHKAGKELIGIYSYKNIRDIYVYYKQGDCFIGCYNWIKSDDETFTQEHFNMSSKEWKSYASGQLTSTFLKINDSILFLCPLKRKGATEVTCLAVVELDEKDLKQILPKGNNSVKAESYNYIINSNGSLITTTGDKAKASYGYGTLKQGENYIDDKVITCKRMENADWEYISIVPLTQYLKEIYNLHYILYVYISFIILLASGIVYYETKRRFRPVQILKENIEAGNRQASSLLEGKDNNQDIFSHLQNVFKDIVYDNTTLKSRLKREKDILSGKKLSEMMGKHTNVEDTGLFFEDNFSMKFRQGIIVIVNEISHGNKFNNISPDEYDAILLLCLNNIGTELYGEHYKCFFWRFVEITGVIWTDREEEESSYLYITNVLEQIRNCIHQYFEVELRFSLSRLCHSPSNLYSAHDEAKAAYDYSYVTGKSGMIRYDESYTQLHANWNDMDIIKAEQDFMLYMLEHNYVKAKDKLELIIAYYGYTDGTSIQLLKCRMFGLINLMLNAIEMDKTPDEEQFYSDLNPVQRLLQAATIQVLKNEIMSIIEALILHYNEKEETTDKKLIYIDRYIEGHYMEHDLSVQQLADKFKLSFSFLSKIYKQQRGEGVLEAINACRIRHVKEILSQEPEVSLTQIAERVGYGNVQTMLRVLKSWKNKLRVNIGPGKENKLLHSI